MVSGQFLLDSESQLQEAIRKMLARRSGGEAESAEPDPEHGLRLPHASRGWIWSRRARPLPGLRHGPGARPYTCPMHPEVVSESWGVGCGRAEEQP